MDAQPEIDLDPNFEPQIRARSNTWPCRPIEDADSQSSPASDEAGHSDIHGKDSLSVTKKTSSRRNAWGNMSYADLITKAVESSPEKRLTLSQIYDWMVQNVPYFKDKGDSTSSAGWKNSIRHNLSLHSRFMRIQNEGTGKSSWWVINPDAKAGKTPRRRAGSMETKSYEKKRGRIKKRVEALRAAQENGNSMSSVDDFADSPLHAFQLSPEFRPRASSNASSCGRLSPIQAAQEPDLHDNQVPPMSPIPWATEENNMNFGVSNDGFTDSLADTLVDSMTLADAGYGLGESGDIEMLGTNVKQELMSGGSMRQFTNQNSTYDDAQFSRAPPPYSEHLQQANQQPVLQNLDGTMGMQNRNYQGIKVEPQDAMSMYQGSNVYPEGLIGQNCLNPVTNPLGINTSPQGGVNSPGRSPQLSPSNYSGSRNFSSQQPQQQSPRPITKVSPQQQQQMSSRSLLQQCLEAPNDSLLRAALTQTPGGGNAQYQQSNVNASRPPQFAQYCVAYNNSNAQMPSVRNTTPNVNPSLHTLTNVGTASYGQQNMAHQQQLQQSQNYLPPPSQQGGTTSHPNSSNSLSEIDASAFLPLSDDVEQSLWNELSMDESLDFNFDTSASGGAATSESHNMVR